MARQKNPSNIIQRPVVVVVIVVVVAVCFDFVGAETEKLYIKTPDRPPQRLLLVL